eukprot:TRINITY_DN3177_c1_g1_i1.p1 TRINITY_DN3177_c1_g1~~TRINITY_DN3177_c1_g1_i1.p1  ORF type:complete len:311 (+),score=48.06 TRINITY_DN3177_c1_g1_i1:98-934(+)
MAQTLGASAEQITLYENSECSGEGTDLMGADDRGIIGTVGQCFAYKGVSVMVGYEQGSCEDYGLPILTFTEYSQEDCEGMTAAKVTLMKNQCVDVNGRSVKYTTQLSDSDYCKYLKLMQNMKIGASVTRIWTPSSTCEGPPLKEMKEKLKSKHNDCAGCCFVPGKPGSTTDAYQKIAFTCTDFGKAMMSMAMYTDDKCATLYEGHPVNNIFKKKPFVIDTCNSFEVREGMPMSMMVTFEYPFTVSDFCSVVLALAAYDLDEFKGTFLDSKTFNASRGG